MLKGFSGLPTKAIGQNIKANGKKALRIIDYIIDYKEHHGQLSSKDQRALLSSQM